MLLRIVADTNVYISAVLSPCGPAAQIIEQAPRHVTLVMNDALCAELTDVLTRDRFRRWLTDEEAQDFIDSVVLLAEWAPERPANALPLVCADPDDNYLVALYFDGDAHLLVSGDNAVQRISYPNLHVCTPSSAVEAIAYRHEWGDGFLPGDDKGMWFHVAAEGNVGILTAYSTFSSIISQARDRDEAAALLPFVTEPSAVKPFVEGLELTRMLLANRGLATRPWYAAPEVAYLRLPPDSAVAVRAIGEVRLPSDTIIATMVRRIDLPDPPGLDFNNWRVFAIGSAVALDDIPL